MAVVSRAIPSKPAGLDGNPSFIIKDYSGIFTLLLTYTFNFIVNSRTFLSLWKQTAAIFPVLKKDNNIFSNYRPIYTFNNFSKISEFTIYDILLNIFKYSMAFVN
jgi:hypothetical protein